VCEGGNRCVEVVKSLELGGDYIGLKGRKTSLYSWRGVWRRFKPRRKLTSLQKAISGEGMPRSKISGGKRKGKNVKSSPCSVKGRVKRGGGGNVEALGKMGAGRWHGCQHLSQSGKESK